MRLHGLNFWLVLASVLLPAGSTFAEPAFSTFPATPGLSAGLALLLPGGDGRKSAGVTPMGQDPPRSGPPRASAVAAIPFPGLSPGGRIAATAPNGGTSSSASPYGASPYGATPYHGPDGIRPDYRPGGRPLVLYKNRMVEGLIDFYLGARRAMLERGYRRSGQYLAMIRRIFASEGVPAELAYLALVESNFNPLARSPARAVGIWQFTAPTGRLFGLRIRRPWYDERQDPESSTYAAARFLAYLYDRYESWDLALAAYNAGEGRVNRALLQAKAAGKPADYWSLALPRQTRGYVPAFLAVASIMENPAGHGLDPGQLDPPFSGDVLEVNLTATLADLAERIGISTEELARLNPAWRGQVLPHFSKGRMILRLPHGSAPSLLISLRERPPRPISWLEHRIAKGETISHLAVNYGVKTNAILALNGLGRRTLLQIGQRVFIPVRRSEDPPGEKPGFSLPIPDTPPPPNSARHLHRAREGESSWSISGEVKAVMEQLRSWTTIPREPAVRPDQELVLFIR